MREIARKLTAATILSGVSWKEPFLNGEGTSTPLFVIMGEASGIEPDKSQYGEFDRFTGIFEATRVADGKVFQSSKVIFPPPTDYIVRQAFMDARVLRDDAGKPVLDDKGKPQLDPNAKVRFAFMIGAEQHSRADAQGVKQHNYRFTCSPIDGVGTAPTDPFADMRQAVTAALPAPPAQSQLSDQSGAATDDKTAKKADKASA